MAKDEDGRRNGCRDAGGVRISVSRGYAYGLNFGVGGFAPLKQSEDSRGSYDAVTGKIIPPAGGCKPCTRCGKCFD